jgi:hypothetical protein
MRPTAHGSGAPDLGGAFRIAALGSPTGCQNAASELGQSQKVTPGRRPCGRIAEYLRPVLRLAAAPEALILSSSARVAAGSAAPAHRALGLHAGFPAPPEMVRRSVKQLVMSVAFMALVSVVRSRRSVF